MKWTVHADVDSFPQLWYKIIVFLVSVLYFVMFLGVRCYTIFINVSLIIKVAE